MANKFAKSETPKVEKSTDTEKVAERLDFFFSDANLRTDKFLRSIVMDTYAGGFCAIETLLKFNTIKSLTTDPAVVAEAAATCKKLKINETKTSIARTAPFTEDMLKDNVKVSLRISDIPMKDDAYVNTRDEVKAVFEEFGKVAMVRLLTVYDKNKSKRIAVGKGFVEFESIETFEKAAAELCASPGDAGVKAETDAKPNRVLKLGDSELRIKTMQQWQDKRNAKRESRDKAKVGVKRDRDEKAKKVEAELEAIEFKLEWKKGCVIKLHGLAEGTDREKIIAVSKSVVGEDAEVRADYNRGDKDGKIRFGDHSDKIAELATKLNDGSATIGDTKVESASIMEGEEEEKYYAEYIALRTKQLRDRAQEKQQRKKFRKRY